jgi:hypothetical protein
MARETEREPAARTIRKFINPEKLNSVPELISFINCKIFEKM